MRKLLQLSQIGGKTEDGLILILKIVIESVVLHNFPMVYKMYVRKGVNFMSLLL